MRRAVSLLLALALCMGAGAAALAGENAGSGVAYEIFVGSFADSDGDGTGDLRGIAEKLGYLTALGIDRIWLTPVFPSPSYHHYDVTDYMDVDPAFGTLEDFDALAAACGEAGIDIILDLPVNHTSSEHPWFLEAREALASGVQSEKTDWYCFTRGSGQHPVPAAEDWYYEGQFGFHMPDLNLDCAQVRGAIAEIVGFWQGHGVKGFRLDAVKSYYAGAPGQSAEFIRWLTGVMKANDPECYVVGECWADDASILAFYESGIDSLFAFPLADVDGVLIRAALNEKGAAAARRAAAWNESIREVSPQAQDAPFLTNHDIARVRGMLRSDVQAMKAAAMLYLLLPGRPFVYYGEELGMSGSGRDENKRLPMLWSASDEGANCLPPEDADQRQRLKAGVAEQEDDPESLLRFYRETIALRAEIPELARGVMRAEDAGSDAVAFYTVTDGSTVAVWINTSRTETFRADPDACGFGGAELVGTLGVDAERFAADGTLPPVSCAVLRRTEGR